MLCKHDGIVINNISLPINASFEEAFSVAKKRLKSAGISRRDVTYSVFRKSVDARRKDSIKFVYSVMASADFKNIDERILKRHNDIQLFRAEKPEIVKGTEERRGEIVVVGSGPCGLFCALMLAEQGYKPIVLERGGSVKERQAAIDKFKETRVLDVSSNIQFGAGGAGTFSDGKLVTRINDPLCNFVLESFVKYGAPENILYNARPHIGTDILSLVICRIIDRIEELEGRVLFNTTFLGFEENNGTVHRVKTDKGEIECSDLVLAIGHSARDTYEWLINKDLSVEAKPFSVGMRIEHSADMIDKALYGDFAGHPALGRAEYNLSYNTKQRGVYTFCMCPGGVVVPATSELFGVVTNGMSYHARDGRNSNSAVLCSIFKDDYGGKPLDAINFQRQIERLAYLCGGSNYSAPICTVGDFLNGRYGTEPSSIIPTYMDGVGIALSKPENYLPEFVCSGIKNAIIDFDKKIKGFASKDAILTGAETRTSAPVRILRNSELFTANKYSNLYPAGEGAGYAGGITSAAIDGIKCALNIIKKYKS